MHKKYLIAGLFGLVLNLCINTASATDINGLNLQGEPVNLQSLVAEKQWNIVMVWASYCSVCKRDFPKVNQFIHDHENDPIRLVGISLDGPERIEEVQQAVKKYQLEFASIISDVNDFGGFYQFETDYNFAGTPTYMVYNPNGMLVAHGSGPMNFDELSVFIENQL